MVPRRWTDEQLVAAVKTSTSAREVLDKLGLAVSGSMARTVKLHIVRLKLDTAHWINVPNPARIQFGNKAPLDAVLVENSPWSNRYIRRRIVGENIIPYACSVCGLSQWNNDAITLQLDHVNGNRKDNRLENLRFLCPNCHSQTVTWGTRQRRSQPPNIQRRSPTTCERCGETKLCRKSRLCRRCAGFLSPSKITWPPVEELAKMIEETSYLAVGRKLGVSDNAIRKHMLRRSDRTQGH